MPTVDVTHEAAARKASLSPDSREVSEAIAALVARGPAPHSLQDARALRPCDDLRRYAHDVLEDMRENAARAMDKLF
jgi:hypothetical protein